MNRTYQVALSMLVLATTLCYACTCSCECENNAGCKILTAKQLSTGDTIELRTYCSQTNFASDEILQDSVQAFYNRHQATGIVVNTRDSIYRIDEHDDLNCNEANRLRERGYECACAK
jgi:hypothetical protein